MANTAGAKGFHPSGTAGSTGDVRTNMYSVLATNGTAIFMGDIVKLVSTGGGLAEGLPVVEGTGAASADMVGVVVGIYDSTGRQMIAPTMHLAVSTAGYVLVADDPNLEMIVQAVNSGTALTDSCIGDQADAAFGSGNTTTGGSAMELSTTLKTAGQQGQFFIKRLAPIPGNTWGAQCKVVVGFAEHIFKAARVAI